MTPGLIARANQCPSTTVLHSTVQQRVWHLTGPKHKVKGPVSCRRCWHCRFSPVRTARTHNIITYVQFVRQLIGPKHEVKGPVSCRTCCTCGVKWDADLMTQNVSVTSEKNQPFVVQHFSQTIKELSRDFSRSMKTSQCFIIFRVCALQTHHERLSKIARQGKSYERNNTT